MNIVTIGGGTGQYHVLRALMRIKERFGLSVTAIPTTTDSGSSSGMLRVECQIVAVGDISQCIFALHPNPEDAAWIFEHRFNGKQWLNGHSTRNFLVAGAIQKFGPVQTSIDKINKAFKLEGAVTPVTFSGSHVHAKLMDGTHLESEDAIYHANIVKAGGVERLWLEPDAIPNMAAIDAIKNADVIVVCPGTLLCSIIPNLLVTGVKEALCNAAAEKIFVCNLMNRPGHTPPGSTVLDHVASVEAYLEENFFSTVIANTETFSPYQQTTFDPEMMVPEPSEEAFRASGRGLVGVPLIEHAPPPSSSNDPIAHLRAAVRHDPIRLAHAFEIALGPERTYHGDTVSTYAEPLQTNSGV